MADRSKCSRGKDSNTANPSPSPAKKWLLTIKETDIKQNELINMFQNIGVYYKFQLEQGETTNYMHYQCYIELKEKKRLTYFKSILPTAHCEKVRNVDAAIKYCGKEETRQGTTQEWRQPKYPNIKVISEDKFYNWQVELLNKLREEPDDRSIYWYWSEKGKTGKSQFSKYLVVKHDALMIGSKANDIFYAITTKEPKPKILIMDIPRCISPEKIAYEAIENVKGGVFFSGKYESQQTVMNSPHILIFSNYEPMLDFMSIDRWIVKRIDNCN